MRNVLEPCMGILNISTQNQLVTVFSEATKSLKTGRQQHWHSLTQSETRPNQAALKAHVTCQTMISNKSLNSISFLLLEDIFWLLSYFEYDNSSKTKPDDGWTWRIVIRFGHALLSIEFSSSFLVYWTIEKCNKKLLPCWSCAWNSKFGHI